MRNKYIFIALGFALFLLSNLVYADPNAQIITEFQEKFKSETGKWIPKLSEIAIWLLLSLSLLSWTWNASILALKGADLQELITSIFQMIMVTGFFYAMILNAEDWSTRLIDGFVWAGNAASSGSVSNKLNPAGILERGMILGSTIMDNSGTFDILIYVVLALTVIIIYSLIASYALLVFLESYIVTSAGVLMLGFGGSPLTSDYAKRIISYCFSVGVKLYVMFLIVGLGERFLYEWAIGGDLAQISTILSIIAVLIMLSILVKMVPDFIQGVISGASIGNPSSLVSTTVSTASSFAGSAASTTVAALKGGGTLGYESIRSAVIKNQQATGNALGTTGGGAGEFLKGVSKTAINAAQAMRSSTAETATNNAVGSLYSGNNLLSQSARNLREKNTAEKLGLGEDSNYISPATDLTKKG